MKVGFQPLSGAEHTGREMMRLINSYNGDLDTLAHLPLKDFFHHVSLLPYRKDPKNVEFIQRPKYSLKYTPFRDCDDKSILMASWAKANGIPFRLIAAGNKEYTHVFPEFFMSGRWVAMDATYKHFLPGTERPYRIRKVIGDNSMAQLATLEGERTQMGSLSMTLMAIAGKAAQDPKVRSAATRVGKRIAKRAGSKIASKIGIKKAPTKTQGAQSKKAIMRKSVSVAPSYSMQKSTIFTPKNIALGAGAIGLLYLLKRK